MSIEKNFRKVALVIPVYNRRDTTLRALSSLSRIDRSGLEVRIFVVDDGSTDGTAEAIKAQFKDVAVIPGDGTLHYAGGTNKGIEAALRWRADHIVTMNDDAVYHESFLVRLVAAAEANPRSVVGALLLLWDQPHKVFQVDPKWNTLGGGWSIPDDLTAFDFSDGPREVECIVGNCVLFPAAAIAENGLMDDKKFPNGWGDSQYTVRMRKNGWRLLIEPRALVWCEPNTYPAPLHAQPGRSVLKFLFFDTRHPLNLWRQFILRWESAPSRLSALLAYTAYLVSLVGKSVRFATARLGGFF